MSHDVTFRLLTHLRVWFYRRIEPLSLVQLQLLRSGDLLSRAVSDIEELQNLYLRVISPPLVALMVTAGTAVAFALFDQAAALLLLFFMLAAGTLLPILAWWSGKRIGRNTIECRTQLNTHLVDSVQGLPDALALGYAASLQDRLSTINKRLGDWERRMGRLDGLQTGLSVLMTNLAAVSVLWVAAGRVDGVLLATLALGAIAAFEAITPLALAGQNLGRELQAARRVFEIIERTPAVPGPSRPEPVPASRPTLSLNRVTFRYLQDPRPALENLSLTVPYGNRVLVTGASGAGKSSLINVLLRFADYESGQIEVAGTDLRAMAHADVRRLFGVMTQRTHLFNTTIGENIRIGRPDASQADIIAAARQAQIHHFIKDLPAGYDTDVGEGGALLSGGERQRIALARMLLKDAPIWLLDEITANLDPLTAAGVLEAVLQAGEGRTLILMTHRIEMVAPHHFDRRLNLSA